MTGPAFDAALDLLQGRARVLKPEINALGSKYDDMSESGLTKAIGDAGRQVRPLLGLILSDKVLRRAISASSAVELQSFAFRFGAHLKASVSKPGLGAEDRVILATAARELFETHQKTRRQSQETEQILERLPVGGDHGPAWKRQFRMSEDEFKTRVVILSSRWRQVEPIRFTPELPARRPTRLIDATQTFTAPTWLRFDVARPSHLSSGQNWAPVEADSSAKIDLERAWKSFENGAYKDAASRLWPLFSAVNINWNPASTPDGSRAWNFLRLVWFLSRADDGNLINRRRAFISGAEMALRSVPDMEELIDWLVDQSLRDYFPADPSLESDWSVHAARLAAVMGSDSLDVYSAPEKAALRQAWGDKYGDIVGGMRQTNQMVDALASEYRFRRQELAQAAEADGHTHRRITAPLRRMEPFLDSDEVVLAQSCMAIASDVIGFLAREDASAGDARKVLSACDQLLSGLSVSESLVLQDTVAPAVSAMRNSVRNRDEENKSGSQPKIVAQLVQTRFPLSSNVSAHFPVQVLLRNDGNSTAELVEIEVESLAIEVMEGQQVVDRITPGAERLVEFSAMSLAEAEIAHLTVDVAWRDHLDQLFSSRVELRAEDQRQSSWRTDDINPFKFNAIAVPSRLIGRQDDLDALERTTAGGGSAAVTGLKRVGKSSLAKTHLTKMRADGWITAYLPLGQILSGSPSAAQFASALLETICDAFIDADADVILPDVPLMQDHDFARVAGRWMRRCGSILGDGQHHVLVAIDDFDELPPSLYDGLEADALFLFIRSVIGETWLSLMFIGSEILPTIIESQAHKLNQVSPHVVSNFSSVRATRQLLEEPTVSKLDWQEVAFNRCHFLSAGNPYYLTLLGRDIWQALRDLDRTFVSTADVNDAMSRVAKTGSLTHFVHLWADSSSGIDGKSRGALISGAVLRAVAQASGLDFSYVSARDIHELTLNFFPTMTDAEYSATVATLVARTVLSAKDDMYRISIPLASAWLTDEGAREIDKQLTVAREERARVRRFANLDLMRLTRNVTFCGEPVNEVRLSGWLEQFPDSERYLAYLLAKRLFEEGYFSNTRLVQEVMPALKVGITKSRAWSTRVTDAGGYAKNVFFLSHGVPGASSHAAASTLAKLLKVKKANIVDGAKLAALSKKSAAPMVVIIADDFAGSGKQLTGVLDDLIAGLSEVAGAWRDNLQLVMAAGIAGSEMSFKAAGVQVETVVGHPVTRRLVAFSEEAEIFETESDREAAEGLLDSVGQSLSPGRPRGFGDLGLLVVTEHNCPNNTLPVFWKAGRHAGNDWLPLFERRL